MRESEKKFLLSSRRGNGKEYSWEVSAASKEEAIAHVEAAGDTVLEIVSAADHHLCKYCNGIAEGSYEELLCRNCRELFGHSLFSEL